MITSLVLVSCAPEMVDLPCPPITAGPLLVTRQPTREVDILLVVDNSGDMDEEQRRLVAQLPRLADAILREEREDEDVDLQSVRFGVVSTDMGSGNETLVRCETPGGDDGLLQNGSVNTIQDECVTGGLDWAELALGEDPEEFARQTQCLANLGGRGCGIEQPLESMLKASTFASAGPIFAEGSTGNGDYNNLLRGDALLVVLILTNEDDCSIADPDLFNRTSATYTDPDLDTRCWRYEDQALHPVRRYVDGLLATVHPARLVFGLLAGIPADLATDSPDYEALIGDERDPRMDGGPDALVPSQLSVSCEVPEDGGAAHAPVRLVQAAQQLDEAGANVVLGSLCQSDYAEVIDRVADAIGESLNRRCLRVPRSEERPPCSYLEVLPEGTRCEGLQGRVLDETRVGQGLCRVCASTADGTLIDPHPGCRQLADEGVRNVGWYSAHDVERDACRDFIAFHPGSEPVIGVRPLHHCISPPSHMPGEATTSTSCLYDASICDDTNLPEHVPLVCDAETDTCQITCESDADCAHFGPDPYVCHESESGQSYCQTACCGC